MEKKIAKTEYVVGWSTKQKNLHIRRIVRYFNESEYDKAYSKYLFVSNCARVNYFYMNRRIEYTDGSIKLVQLYHL